MRTIVSLGTTLLFALSPVIVLGQDDQTLGAKSVTDPSLAETYVGFYRIVSAENDGDPIPEERIQSHVIRITQEMIVVLDAENHTLYSCTYTLDRDAKPHRVDMESTGGPAESVGRMAKGIITSGTNEEEKPYVMLCYRMLGDDYPEEFRTQAETEMNLFVLEPIPDPAENQDTPRE